MDTKPTVTKKYKKHKDGFKVGISFKLNTKLKGHISILNDQLTYPVYVEVRARKQMTYFRNSYGFDVTTEEFDMFLNHDIVKSVLEFQTEQITKHLIDFEKDNPDFNINLWLFNYHKHVDQTSVSSALLNILKQKLELVENQQRLQDIKNAVNFPHNNSIFEFDFLSYLVTILKVANEPKTEEIIDMIQTYQRIQIELDKKMMSVLSPLNALFRSIGSLDEHNFLHNDVISRFFETESFTDDSVLQDIHRLRKFILDSKKD